MNFYLKEAECRAMGGARPTESELEESSDDDVYCTANDTFEKENQEDGEDEDGGDEIHRNSTSQGARGRSTRASKPGNGRWH